MTHSDFQKLLSHLQTNHLDIYSQFQNNFVLSDSGLSVFQPAKVSDETYKELADIIDKWATENQCNTKSFEQ